ncbi:hypothetical protein Tco_1185734 [Tanacetum coccineum]
MHKFEASRRKSWLPKDFISKGGPFKVRSDVKLNTKEASGLLQQPEIPVWNGRVLQDGFHYKLLEHPSGIWFNFGSLLTELTKSAHYISEKWKIYKEKLTRNSLGTNLDMSTAYHPETDGQK